MDDLRYTMMTDEIEQLAKYIRTVKKIYTAALIIIIAIFVTVIALFGWDLFRHGYITLIFIITILALYVISIVLLVRFRRKVQQLKDEI